MQRNDYDPGGEPPGEMGAGPESVDQRAGTGRGATRRDVLAGMAGLPLVPLLPELGSRVGSSVEATGGVVRSALHVHTSFSEGGNTLANLASTSTLASMESQVATLAALGADLCFFTDHDFRMAGDNFGMKRTAYPSVEDMTRPHWTYVPDRTASATGGSAAMTTRGLEASVTAGTAQAWRGMFVDSYPTDRDYRTTLAGVTLAFTLRHLSTGGWTEVRIRTSYHPARGGRAAGSYEVHYLFNPAATTKTVLARGLAAVVTVPVPVNQTQRVVVTPTADLRAAFADLGDLVSDNGLYGVWIGAGAAAGRSASTLVTLMEIKRTLTGSQALQLQHSLMPTLSTLYPSVALGAGLEPSYSTHLNMFSRSPSALTFQAPQPGETKGAYLNRLVRTIHTAGGVASYNHPFGASIGVPLTGSARTDRIAQVARGLFTNRLYGCDVLEVGYELRGSMDVAGHLDLWDVLLSAGLRVMANGVSDDHAGTLSSWTGGTNQYFTDIISTSKDPAQVTPLLGRGRAFVSLRTGFAGMLDLACDGIAMGATRTATGTSADITITADGVPTNGTLRVLQFAIHGDTTRVTRPTPRTNTSYPAIALTGGQITIRLPNIRSYVRAEVRNSTGKIVAFSNPLWLTPST